MGTRRLIALPVFCLAVLCLVSPSRSDVLSLWDLEAVRSEPLDVKVIEDRPGIDLKFPHRELHLTYLSQKWKGQEVRIEAFVAIPAKREGKVAGVLSLHGHGGAGGMGDAVGRAREFKAVGMSISGPGQGLSTGRRDCMAHWIDTVPDPRDSFMYQYPYAAMRAITYLTSLAEVDAKRIGVIGGSMGAMCTLIVNGLDDRVTAAVPVSGCGSYGPEMEAGKTWFSRLILDALKVEMNHPGVQGFLNNIDPIHYARTQRGACLMVCGAQDEPFPITCLARTFERMPSSARLSIVYDCNHGGFSKPDVEFKMYDNVPQWTRRAFGTAHGWLHRYLDPPKPGAADRPVPKTPKLSVTEGKENTVTFSCEADSAESVQRVLLCWSLDGSFTFQKAVMNKTQEGRYELAVVLHQAERDALCAYAEVEYPDNFFLTSMPHFGGKFDVQVRRTRFPLETYRREMSTDQAIAEYRKELAAPAGSLTERLDKHYQFGKFCVAVGKPQEAIDAFEVIIQQGKDLKASSVLPNALYHQAAALVTLKQFDRAIANLERAITLYPQCKDLDGKEVPRARELLNKTRAEKRKQ